MKKTEKYHLLLQFYSVVGPSGLKKKFVVKYPVNSSDLKVNFMN